MTTRKALLAALVAAVSVGAVAVGTTSTAGASGVDSGNALTGAWRATINLPDPQADLQSLQVFAPDGGFVEMSTEPQASRTAQYGSWERIGGRLYAATGIVFRFDPSGAHVATMTINRTIRLSRDGQSMEWVARVTVRAPNGAVLQSFPVTSSATRLPVERIADEP